MRDADTLERLLDAAGTLDRTYWVCAFCVSQHDGICAANPFNDTDPVTGTVHPTCACSKPKAFNDTPPLRELDQKSIPCQMNKFSDMMAFISSTNSEFEQVVAIDPGFDLFSRAWCVDELWAASR